MNAIDLRPFVPSRDVQQSLAFYRMLGCTLGQANDHLTLAEWGECHFFIQDHYQQDFAENCMLQLIVTDLDDIEAQLSAITAIPIRFEPIRQEPWGRVIYLWGPAGELWHLTELNPPP